MSESEKESLRQSFANLRKALPEGITEADADILQDVGLRLMDRGLPRPAVFRYDEDGDVSAYSGAGGKNVGPILDIANPADDAERTRFADEGGGDVGEGCRCCWRLRAKGHHRPHDRTHRRTARGPDDWWRDPGMHYGG